MSGLVFFRRHAAAVGAREYYQQLAAVPNLLQPSLLVKKGQFGCPARQPICEGCVNHVRCFLKGAQPASAFRQTTSPSMYGLPLLHAASTRTHVALP